MVSWTANCRPLINRSAARRIAPAGAEKLAISNEGRHCRVAVAERKHIAAMLHVVLSIILNKRFAETVVMVFCFFAIRAAGFCIDHQGHCSNLHLLAIIS